MQLHASAQRFVRRRIEHALLGGTTGHTGREAQLMRGRSALSLGGLAAAVGAGGCAVLAYVQPAPVLGSAPIVMGQQSGALYVQIDATVHPVLNLASARLIAAVDADPRPVRESDLAQARRGPLLGIPGAPQALGPALADAATWSVCDTPGPAGPAATVLVTTGPPQPDAWSRTVEQPVLVSADGAATNYLLFGGRRTAVSRTGSGPAESGFAARPVSAVLLNAVPETTDNPGRKGTPDRRAVPLPSAATLCVHWARVAGGDAAITVSAGAGLPLPPGAAPVVLAGADGAGPGLDAVYLPPGRSAFVRSAGVSGQTGGERYLVSETGVRFAVGDDAAARSLGVPTTAAPAPWPVLSALPAGPQLSRQDALVARAVVAAGR